MSEATIEDVDDLLTDSNISEVRRYLSEIYGEEVYGDSVQALRTEDFISGPFLSDNCTIPENILEFDHSYGYDCKKYFNLAVPDESTIVFSSGNLLHFYNARLNVLWFRRSYLGGGIGHITVNPSMRYAHLTVAENGDNPPIIIYQWPTLDIVGVLKGGASKRYSHINYSPDGELLVSQSYGPDFLITVWKWKNWRKSPIILRIKSHVTDVYKVMFSPYVPGQITTGGAGHIKFWKMAETFTGLKLQGELGRFGKTEISDIIGIHPMPDEKVISGSEWGNILVWEAGLIKVEVRRTLKRTCHDGPIMHFMFNQADNRLWTVAQDGWLRSWYYGAIEDADPPDDNRTLEALPTFERHYEDIQFLCVCKQKPFEDRDQHYYIQDGHGGIWLVDFRLMSRYDKSVKLITCHAGAVVSLAACPWGPYFVSFGEDGKLFLYDYEEKLLIYQYEFPAKGRDLLWMPISIDTSGLFIIAGFDDGVVRVCALSIKRKSSINLTLLQSTKPHNKPITKITMNSSGTIFVSAAEDNTLFIYAVEKSNTTGLSLTPIGFVKIANYATCFCWRPTSKNVLLVGCLRGQLYEFVLPENQMDYTEISYFLYTIEPKMLTFTSCKAQIRRDEYLKEVAKRKAEKLLRKKEELIKIKNENPGLEIDEETYLLDSEPEEELEPLYIPQVPNRIWFIKCTPDDTIWISMGGYDAGYIYEYQIGQTQKDPIKATLIEDADDIEMHRYLYSYDGKYLITSMENGAIRVNRVNEENFRDLSDYWMLHMHDNFNGRITDMCFSYDHKYLFSAGADGNIFSYTFNPEQEIDVEKPSYIRSKPIISSILTDEGYESLSLEEKMIKAEEEKQLALANKHKEKLRARLKQLTDQLASVLRRNCALPKSQRFKLNEFIIDERIMNALDERLEAKIALEKRKLAYDVEKSNVALNKMKAFYIDILDVFPISVTAINTTEEIFSLSQRNLGSSFFAMRNIVAQKLKEEEQKGRITGRDIVTHEVVTEVKKRQQELEPFLMGLSPSTIAFKLGAKINRLLKKYRERRMKQERRKEEWNALYASKPIPGANHPDDEKAIKIAQSTIGDYKLKTAPDYKRPAELQESTVKKYEQLLETRLTAYKSMVHAYNVEVYGLRERKVNLIKTLEKWKEELLQIQSRIPEKFILEIPPIPQMTDADFPEANLNVVIEVEDEDDSQQKSKTEEESNPKQIVEDDASMEGINLAFNYKHPDLDGDIEDILNVGTKLNVAIQESLDNIGMDEKDEETDTYWEREYRIHVFLKNIKRQEFLVNSMKDEVEKFDRAVESLKHNSLEVAVKANYMDLYLLLLNQELVIVKDFETVELELQGKVKERMNEMYDMKDNIARIENSIEAHQRVINSGIERIKDLQQQFTTAAKNSTFYDFLRRIFKKKYRPPKVYDPDASDSSSASSETSSESEDAYSLDSGDIGPIRLDESVCPKGCDKELYDFTFALRDQRHAIEKQAKEEQKTIELLRKDVEVSNKKLKVIDVAVQQSNQELEEFQRVKQKKLNELLVTVVLHLNQMQHFSTDESMESSDILVFNKSTLSRLYARVGELQMETLQERAKHNKNKIHLHRMNIDCKYMEEKIDDLKKQKTETMKTKFGRKVDMNELEEAVLRLLVQNLKISLTNVHTIYEKDVKNVKESLMDHQKKYKQVIEENTARLELIDCQMKEKAHLLRALETQKLEIEKAPKKDELKNKILEDCQRLENISKSQKEEIEALKAEIKMLSTKSLPMKPVSSDATKIDLEKLPNVQEDELIEELEAYEELYLKAEEHIQLPSRTEEVENIEVTEKDILVCVSEIVQEIIISANNEEENPEKIVTKVISELLAQIPSQYILSESNLKQIRSSIHSIIKVDEEEFDKERIKEEVLNSVFKVVSGAENIVETIITTIFSTEENEDA